MIGWFHVAQLGFALFLAVVIVGRARYLLWRAPVADEALRWVRAKLGEGNRELALAWARTSRSHVGSLIVAGCAPAENDADGDLETVLADLSYAATLRLGLLRVCATIASTSGLLGGILAIQRGFGRPTGLLALKAGLAQQVAVSEALVTMALGVGLSAICFQALAVFRSAAREVIAQSTQVAHLLRDRDPVRSR